MAIARKFRLSKDKDIEQVFARGATVRGRFFFIKFLSNQLQNVRWAVVVSKKISNKAVTRNLVKRRLRALAYQWSEQFFKNGLDIVITTTPAIVGKDFKEIKSDFDQTIKKVISK